jgi:hypothetical protein
MFGFINSPSSDQRLTWRERTGAVWEFKLHLSARRVLMLLLLVLTATTLVLFTPKILWSFAPHAVSAVPQDRVASEFYWRLRFYIKKATGGVPDLSWAEVVKGTWPGRQLKGTWPGSGFITGKVITEAAA